MKLYRIAFVSIALGALATASVGQESQPAPAPAKPQTAATPAATPAAPPPAESAPAGAPAAGGAQAPASAGAQAPPAAPRMPVVKDDEFIPTQELQPDEDVTFPVDI